MKKETFNCDICGNEKVDVKNFPLTVIFTTEQNEGRTVPPYIDTVRIDFCGECKYTLISGKMVFAEGAMGYNKYYFKQIVPLKEGIEVYKDYEKMKEFDKLNEERTKK